jgi:hypothetical protein
MRCGKTGAPSVRVVGEEWSMFRWRRHCSPQTEVQSCLRYWISEQNKTSQAGVPAPLISSSRGGLNFADVEVGAGTLPATRPSPGGAALFQPGALAPGKRMPKNKKRENIFGVPLILGLAPWARRVSPPRGSFPETTLRRTQSKGVSMARVCVAAGSPRFLRGRPPQVKTHLLVRFRDSDGVPGVGLQSSLLRCAESRDRTGTRKPEPPDSRNRRRRRSVTRPRSGWRGTSPAATLLQRRAASR